MKLPILRATLIFVLGVLAALAALAQAPPPFSADMKTTSPRGLSTSGKIYFSGNKVRIESTMPAREGAEGRPAMGPRTGIFITDLAQHVSYVLMAQQHMYMEMHLDQMGGQRRVPDWKMYDRSNPCANEPDTTCKKAGSEVINGRSCDRWEFAPKNSGAFTVWIDQKTGIPVKRQMADGMVLELANIQEGPQPDSLFEVPPGYQKIDMGGMMRGMQPPQ